MINKLISKVEIIFQNSPLAKNTFYAFIERFFDAFVGFLSIILISNQLGAEGIGVYSFIFSFSSIFFLFSELGLNNYIIKNFANNKLDFEFLSMILKIRIFSFFIIFIVFFVIVFLLFKEFLLYFIIISLFHLFRDFRNFFNSINKSQNEGSLLLLGNFSERLLYITLILVLFYFNKLSLYNLFFISFLTVFLQFLFFYFKYDLKINLFKGMIFKKIKEIIYSGLPFLFFSISIFLLHYLDQIVLFFFEGAEVLGWYSVGYKLIKVFTMFPVIILSFGFTSFLKNKNLNFRKDIFDFLCKILVIIGFSLLFFLLFFSPFIINYLFDFNSPETITNFRILSFSLIFIFLTQVQIYYLSSMSEEKFISKIFIYSIFINLILNIILIPLFSLYGAAISTIISYILMFFLLNKKSKLKLESFYIKIICFYFLIFFITKYLVNNFFNNIFLEFFFISLILVCISLFFLLKLKYYFSLINNNSTEK